MSRYLVRYKDRNIERTIPLDAASVGLAREACQYHHPGCLVVSVQEATPPGPAKPARPQPVAVAQRRATEEQTRAVADGLRALRGHLAAATPADCSAVVCPECAGPARIEFGRHSRRRFIVPLKCPHARVLIEP